MIQILYDDEHKERAVALASETPGSRSGEIEATPPTKITEGSLDALTFWGHGSSDKFCGREPDELAKLIGMWRKLNSGLKTVELITCDARHYYKGDTDAYADKLKSAMRCGFLPPTSGMKVKALPVTVTGKQNGVSILLAETVFKTWAYLTAPAGAMSKDEFLMPAQSLVRFIPGKEGGFEPYKGNLAVRANELAKEQKDRNWTIAYGYLNTLRAYLAEV
jgi:hypothetical protein